MGDAGRSAGWSVYYDEAEPSIGVCICTLCVCMWRVISLHYHNTLLTSIDDEWNKYIKEKQEEERIKKRSTADMGNENKTRTKRRKNQSGIVYTALIELPPFRLFSSLSLCLRQRSDQTESTISEAITLDGAIGKGKIISSEEILAGQHEMNAWWSSARVYSVIFPFT